MDSEKSPKRAPRYMSSVLRGASTPRCLAPCPPCAPARQRPPARPPARPHLGVEEAVGKELVQRLLLPELDGKEEQEEGEGLQLLRNKSAGRAGRGERGGTRGCGAHLSRRSQL